MPKIIKNIQKNILEAGKEELLTNGYLQLTVRKIAQECHIAVGTFYNYFPSKDVLVARILLDDWQGILETLSQKINACDSCISGLQLIYDSIRQFSDRYRSVWADSSQNEGISGVYQRHSMLVSQLMKPVSELLDDYHVSRTPDPAWFITEILLNAGCRAVIPFEELRPFFEKIIN